MSACAPQADSPSTTATLPVVEPYQTVVPGTLTATVPAVIEPAPLPLATATPFVYTVIAGDNLIAIAARFNLTLDELLAANPGVDPAYLFVGIELVIPSGDEGVIGALPTPTPVPLQSLSPQCYPNASGGLWCFWQVVNQQQTSLENISAAINLFDSAGQQVASQIALSPLNVLLPGEAIPLATYFQSPVPAWDHVQAQLLTALSVSVDDQRYLPAQVAARPPTIAESGLSALVEGQVGLADEGKDAVLVWVVAVAYDVDGNVVGIRRWEDTAGIEAGANREFQLRVYSLGTPIERVVILVEARP